jgi:hypothetical protein
VTIAVTAACGTARRNEFSNFKMRGRMSETKKTTAQWTMPTRRQVLQGGLAAGALAAGEWLPLPGYAKSSSTPAAVPKRLFPAHLAHGEWEEFPAEGFPAPVIGVIHRREYAALCGVPLGGIGTGFLNLDTGGLFGLCSIFNSHTPRRGAMNWPFLGLSVNGQTWVLTTGQQSAERGSGAGANKPQPPDLVYRA